VTVPAPLRTAGTCRSCGSTDLSEVLAFGDVPIADRLVPPDDPSAEFVAPLTLMHCSACTLCQIRETVSPRVLFGPDYPYYSSVSHALLRHFTDSAHDIIARRRLSPDDLVVEAASNDGYMLQSFHEAGIPVLGIDPADGPVDVARKKGIETIHDFFTASIARKLAGRGRRASVFLANNVLAHVEDVNDFVAGIAALLTEDGMAVIEVPYLIDLVDTGAFDTIYHQHLLYLSVTALVPLFARHDLHLNDVERTWVHGGSLRLFVTRAPGQSPRIVDLLADEATRGVGSPNFFLAFVERIAAMREETRAAISRLRREGATVVGYGAAAKATTLLHAFGLDRDDLDFIVDKSPWKQGLAMPVTRIPILPPAMLAERRPDAVVLLAWNFAEEIIAENRAYLEAGGRFVIPVPHLKEVALDPAETEL
jgi:SAM-dependent methyltransferase